MNDQLEIIELQGTAEAGSFSRTQLDRIMDLAELGIKDLLAAQRQALGDFNL
jgi:ribonuclease PH